MATSKKPVTKQVTKKKNAEPVKKKSAPKKKVTIEKKPDGFLKHI